MSRDFTFLSLFSGIGGLDLGLERAGMRCVGQVEIDPFCRRVLAKHWPDVPRFEDVRTVTAGDFHEHIDCIAGGFPCQDISNAGSRVGIDGDRSGLWSEFARLIRQIRPRFVIVENVAAILARGIDRVSGDLAAIGYDAEWDCIPASTLGAPHFRSRIFFVATKSFTDANGERRENASERRQPISILGGTLPQSKWTWTTEPPLLRVDDGTPNRLDRNRACGNAVVPHIAEWIGLRIMAAARWEVAA